MEFLQKNENLDMFPSKQEISRSNGRAGDNPSKQESPIQNERVGTYAKDIAQLLRSIMLRNRDEGSPKNTDQ